MSRKRFANVRDAIEDTPAQAENMKVRSALMMALKDHIASGAKPVGGRQAAGRNAAAYLRPHARQDRAVWPRYPKSI
jgi:hypothetical protein